MIIEDFLPAQGEGETRINPFFDNLASGILTTTFCPRCTLYHWQPRIVCPRCLSETLEWRSLPRKGRIYAFSVLESLCVGIIDIGGKVRILSGIEGNNEILHIGDEVFLKVIRLKKKKIFFTFTTDSFYDKD